MTSNGEFREIIQNISTGALKDQIEQYLCALKLLGPEDKLVSIDFDKLLKSTDNEDVIPVTLGILKKGEVFEVSHD